MALRTDCLGFAAARLRLCAFGPGALVPAPLAEFITNSLSKLLPQIFPHQLTVVLDLDFCCWCLWAFLYGSLCGQAWVTVYPGRHVGTAMCLGCHFYASWWQPGAPSLDCSTRTEWNLTTVCAYHPPVSPGGLGSGSSSRPCLFWTREARIVYFCATPSTGSTTRPSLAYMDVELNRGRPV